MQYTLKMPMATGRSLLFAELAVSWLPTAKTANVNRAKRACNYVPELKEKKKGILVSVCSQYHNAFDSVLQLVK